MLLPSDIARLVLGYLQQEGLRATSQAFILESPNLKEYAEHSTDDGAIPACVFSLFGKNLTTILNEYVAVKAKESCHETQVPAMMTSLWKKLDFTLNQIKSMQNSPAVYHNQRLRTRNGIVNMRGQRALSSARPPSTALLSIPPPSGQYDASPLATPQGMLGHSTPVCYSSLQTRPSPLCVSQPQIQDGSRLVINVNRESPLHIVVPDRRINSGPLSPGRRKCDSPRRRGGGLCGPSGTGRATAPSSGPIPDQELEADQDSVTENFPQMVIENAREKILNDKSLQEKLAENINKILGSDTNPQSFKQVTCSTVVQDQSIDEILGLQGEIHMTDDAIRDILEQTESDPAFQALFDLFDYGKNKESEGDGQGDTSHSNTTQESDEADSSSQAENPGASQEEPISGAETSCRALRTRSTQEHKNKKTRKTAHPHSSTPKATPVAPPSRPANEPRPSKRGSSHTRTGTAETRTSAGSDKKSSTSRSTARGTAGKDTSSTSAGRDVPSSVPPLEEGSMEVDGVAETVGLTHTPVQPSALQTDAQESAQTSRDPGGGNSHPSASSATPFLAAAVVCAPSGNSQPVRLPEGQTQGVQADVPQFEGAAQPAGSHPSQATALPVSPYRLDQPNKAGTGHSHSSPCEAPTRGCHSDVQEPAVPGASISGMTVPGTSLIPLPNPTVKEPDPSKIVSLKIIVSDEQEEQSGDSALSQAISSITGERIPTIILSSPAKSPAKVPPAAGTPITQEETVQAVCCLQGADLSSVAGKVGEAGLAVDENVQLSLAGELTQEAGFIQLVPGTASSSYFIMTDPATVSQQSKVMVLPGCTPLGQVSSSSHVLATPPRPVISVAQDISQTYSSGSTLFISSPSQPMLQSMMVPVSVVGQSSVGKFAVVPNQLLQVTAPAVKTPAKVKPKPKLAPKDKTVSGKSKTSVSNLAMKTKDPNLQQLSAAPNPQTVGAAVPPQPPEATEQQNAPEKAPAGQVPAPGSSPHTHRRVLCFDVSAEKHGSTQSPVPGKETPSPSRGTVTVVPAAPVAASPGQQSQKETPSGQAAGGNKPRAIQPAILRGSRTPDAKVRSEVTKCTDNTKPSETLKEAEKSTMGESLGSSSDAVEQGTKTQSTSSRKDTTQPEPSKRKESRRKSQQLEKKDDEGVLSTQTVKSSAPDQKTLKSAGAKKQAEEKSRTEVCESVQKGKEGRPERRSSSQGPHHVTANKENEVERGRGEPHPENATAQGESPASVGCAAPPAQGNPSRAPSMTSPLTKQAAEMLQGIQGQSPASTPSKRLGCPGLPLPRTPGSGRHPEEPADCMRTPVRQRAGRDGEGTPRHLPPPATPDIPTCSPASEAGSENSINMAAHTLMILSRAAIARTGTPLKDSVRQQGAASSTASKGKKRKMAEPLTSPTAKKEAQHSGSATSKKAAKKQKKMLDSFPDDLDVDKFLSSLHYDE
ncbi:protein NPAT-like [Megalops cyprinoides]|uniref:protein NPAT-like n=1 Tax=Megalops cyprinoides TaxID=118141 RepID=UPI001863F988|nr:protein NPAT-like [Megalops cyprinoides]